MQKLLLLKIYCQLCKLGEENTKFLENGLFTQNHSQVRNKDFCSNSYASFSYEGTYYPEA